MDVCINFVGVGLMDEKWIYDRKKVIVNSCIEVILVFLLIVKKMKLKLKLWINVSVIGVYIFFKLMIYFDIEENNYVDNFLGKIVYEWEKIVSVVSDLGICVVYVCFGFVFGIDGGLFFVFEKLF